MTDAFILADGRWVGPNGIGRFSHEILTRLTHTDILKNGPRPLSLKNMVWLPYQLYKRKKSHRVFFMPGFNPVSASPLPFIFTLCDLIHLNFPHSKKNLKSLYYHHYIKPRAHAASFILTLSHYSKQAILEWTNLPPEKIIVVGCGVSQTFQPKGSTYRPDFPYLLHVGNTKFHKNIPRLLKAFAAAHMDPEIRLILTGECTSELEHIIQQHKLQKRIIFRCFLDENTLASYYRGALGVVFPSLMEGFGLPVLEGMASGVPTLTSNTSSLPEIAGSAAILIDPYQVESIQNGIENLVNDFTLRKELIAQGLQQASHFSWDKTANAVQNLLNTF